MVRYAEDEDTETDEERDEKEEAEIDDEKQMDVNEEETASSGVDKLIQKIFDDISSMVAFMVDKSLKAELVILNYTCPIRVFIKKRWWSFKAIKRRITDMSSIISQVVVADSVIIILGIAHLEVSEEAKVFEEVFPGYNFQSIPLEDFHNLHIYLYPCFLQTKMLKDTFLAVFVGMDSA